jgi:hypothetical protein
MLDKLQAARASLQLALPDATKITGPLIESTQLFIIPNTLSEL